MTKIQVAREVAATVAIIFVPKVAYDATVWLIKNLSVLPTAWGLLASLLAASMLANLWQLQKHDGAKLGNSLALMLLVYAGISFVGAVTDNGFAWAFLLCGLALAAMLFVRRRLRPANAPFDLLIIRHEVYRFSAVVFLFAYLHVANGGWFIEGGTWLIAQGILYAVVANKIASAAGLDRQVPECKTMVGYGRWILAFVAGGALINWVAGTADAVFLVFAVVAYAAFYRRETPSMEVRKVEGLAVAGSGAATTLHMIMMRGVLMRIPAVNEVAFLLWGLLCLTCIVWLVTSNGRK